MKKRLPLLTGTLLMLGSNLSGPAYAQVYPVIPLVGLFTAEHAERKAIAERTTTTATYRGQSFPMKRTPDDILAGDAADRITQLETQLALCHTALLADSVGRICPAERLADLQANFKYVGLNRPTWDQKAYRQELKFYQAEDNRRRLAAKGSSK